VRACLIFADFGSTRRQFAEEIADIMTFLLWQFGDPASRPPRQP